jgi:hypothetical protein
MFAFRSILLAIRAKTIAFLSNSGALLSKIAQNCACRASSGPSAQTITRRHEASSTTDREEDLCPPRETHALTASSKCCEMLTECYQIPRNATICSRLTVQALM